MSTKIPTRRPNLPEMIASKLRTQIARGDLAAGAKLPGHRELASMYSVSVGSVREAISMLVSSGLVETHAGRGTYVSATPAQPEALQVGVRLQRNEIQELTEARRVIEVQLAALAAERATPEQIEALERATKRMEAAAASPYGYPEADVDFHLMLAEAAGNRYLLQAMLDIRSLLKQDMELGAEAAIRRFGDLRPSIESHRRLLEAVAGREPERAAEIATEIVDRNQKFVLGLYALGEDGAGP